MPRVTKSPSFVVSLNSDLRPLIGGLNRELASHRAEPIQGEELPEIDRMLHQGLGVAGSEARRCSHWRGYVSPDADGDLTCLNCGRSTALRRKLDDVTQELAQRLIDYRMQQSRKTAGEAP
jgi:hypothetical protein